ncbi:MAG: cytochrome-c oxidase, partial [Acetobacteraceae bacterium]|nr:cytochrome-c oxidase [Acetobacteraceae bacterium]
MTPLILFLAVVACIAGWWLSHQRLTAKPWLEEGLADHLSGAGAVSVPASKIGLGVFFAVAGCLFTLLISAYFMRMGMGDWRPLPMPKLLWINTGVLIASSAALQWTQVSAQ